MQAPFEERYLARHLAAALRQTEENVFSWLIPNKSLLGIKLTQVKPKSPSHAIDTNIRLQATERGGA